MSSTPTNGLAAADLATKLKDEGKKLWAEVAPKLNEVISTNAKAAFLALEEAGDEAVKAGRELAGKIDEVKHLLSKGAIDEESGRLAIDLYETALSNVERAATNKKAQDALARGKSFLMDLKDLALSAGKMALKVGLPLALAAL